MSLGNGIGSSLALLCGGLGQLMSANALGMSSRGGCYD